MAIAFGPSKRKQPLGEQHAAASLLMKLSDMLLSGPMKGTKVVEPSGELKPMFRGLTQPYVKGKTGPQTSRQFFSDDPGIAMGYAMRTMDGISGQRTLPEGAEHVPNIISGFLDIKNPITGDNADLTLGNYDPLDLHEFMDLTDIKKKEAKRLLKRSDGVVGELFDQGRWHEELDYDTMQYVPRDISQFTSMPELPLHKFGEPRRMRNQLIDEILDRLPLYPRNAGGHKAEWLNEYRQLMQRGAR